MDRGQWGTFAVTRLLGGFPAALQGGEYTPKGSVGGHTLKTKWRDVIAVKGKTRTMEFLCTKKVYVTFSWGVWIVMAFCIYLLFEISPLFPDTSGFSVYGVISFGLGVLLNTIALPAAVIIWLGMGMHCAWLDRPRTAAKIGWIVLILVTVCFGASLYFFVVYRKQMIEKYAPA